MLVATRFGLGIKDPAWFEHRFELLSAISTASLLSQSDQSFEWVLRVDSDLPSPVRDKLVEVLAPFEGRGHVCPNNHHALRSLAETRGLVDERGYILLGRIDDDDAWARHTVARVRDRVQNWRSRANDALGYSFTFENGLAWVMYDMIELARLRSQGTRTFCEAAVRAYTYPWTSISGYTYSKIDAGFDAISCGHPEVPDLMMARGCSVDVVSTDEPMWLYCRHKQADSGFGRGEGANLEKSITELGEAFGIDVLRAQRYIANSHQYGYCKVMQKFAQRGKLIRELREIDGKLGMQAITAEEALPLRRRREQVAADLADLAKNLTHSPEYVPGL